MSSSSNGDRSVAEKARTQAIIGVGAIVALGLIYWKTGLHMAQVWLNSVTFRHGLVIVPITAWLIWRRRSNLLKRRLGPNFWGFCGLLVPIGVWWIGRAGDVSVLRELAFIAMVPLLVIAILGIDAFKALRFPLLYLFFAVPVGWFLVPPLMHITAFMATQGLRFTGVPVFQNGFSISVPTGDFLVANACSGIRYLIACLALGTLFAHLFYRSWWRRVLFMLVAAFVPIVANGIRAYGIVLLAYLSDMRIATGFDHVIYGFIFFSFILFLMFWLGSLFREDRGVGTGVGGGGDEGPGAVRSASVQRTAVAGLLAVLMVSLGPLAWSGAKVQAREMPTGSWGTLATGEHGWTGPISGGNGVWQPHFVGQHQQLSGVYSSGRGMVSVFVEAYAFPGEGKGVVSSLNGVTDKPHRIIDERERQVDDVSSERRPLMVRESVIETPTGRRLIWSWYRVGSYSTANRLVEKMREVVEILHGVRGWARWVSVSTPIRGAMGMSQLRLKAFLQDNYRGLMDCLTDSASRAGCTQ